MNIASLVAKPIIALPRVLVTAPSYIERNGAPETPDDLVSHNCLTPNGENHYVWEFLGSDGRRTTVPVTGTIKSSNNSFIKHAALQGLGIALMNEYVVETDIKAGRLTKVLDRYTLPERMLHVLYQKDRYQSLRARLFIDYLSKHLKSAQSAAS